MWEGTKVSKAEWLKFIEGPIWKAILFDLYERERTLLDYFKADDKEWNSDCIRGKLNELDYFRNLPRLIIAAIIAEESQAKKEKKHELDYEEDV